MLSFDPISLQHQTLYNKYKKCSLSTECSFAVMWAWRRENKLGLCERDGILYRHAFLRNPCLLFPFGVNSGNLHDALHIMRDYTHHPLTMRLLCPYEKNLLEETGKFEFEDDRVSADYIYNASDLINLEGRDYHSKRNFITRFKNERSWSFEDITPDIIPAVRAFYEEWSAMSAPSPGLLAERFIIDDFFENWDALGLMGGALYADGKICAFTLGTKIGDDTLDIHVEKADHRITGTYQMINREFAARRAVGGVKYINREEDMGIESLRKAKLSYKPVDIIMKYTAREVV